MEGRTVKVGELALICGLSEKQVQNLANQGVFVKSGRGAYLLAESLRNFLDYRDQPVSTGPIDIAMEEAYTARAVREIKETQAALMKGRVLETEAVMYVVGEVFTLIRNKLISLPDRLIPEIVPPQEVVPAKERCLEMIEEILTELAISGDAIREETDFKRVTAPVSASDVELSSSSGADYA